MNHKIEKTNTSDLNIWWQELPVIIKFCIAENHNNFLQKSISKFIKDVDMDDLYSDLRNDQSISNILVEYNSIRWEQFEYLGEMEALFSDGSDDYESFTDEDNLSSILFDVVKQSPDWFAEVILNNENSDTLINRELQSFRNSKTLKFDCINDIQLDNSSITDDCYFDLKSNFPNLEKIILNSTDISDFEFLYKLDYLKHIHLGILKIPFKDYPNTFENINPYKIKDSYGIESIEYERTIYKENNPDVILLKRFLDSIDKFKDIRTVQFQIDSDNTEVILEPEVLDIVKKRIPKSTAKRINEPIYGFEFEIKK